MGSTALRLAARYLGSAGAVPESVRRGRIFPPVVADLRCCRHYRQRPDGARRLYAVRRDCADRFAPAKRRQLHRAQHLQHHRGGECARTGRSSDGGERLRVIFALLGWLRRHRNGASKKRADSARRHGHRTSGSSITASRARRCRKAGRPTRTAVRPSR